eukprot:SM000007S20861  [mRNA]  locus=s7:594718:596507:+ [translate_table: standard]
MPAPRADSAEAGWRYRAGRILAFMNEQNRPHNAQNVADALQKAGIKKTTAQKALDNLADAGHITSKEYGKQKIYLARQDQIELPSPEDLEAGKKAKLRLAQSSLTFDQIQEQIQKLTDENKAMNEKLSSLRDGAVLMPTDERTAVDKSFETSIALWRRRKRAFRDLWDLITENLPGDTKELQVELGIETDEAAGHKPDDFLELMPQWKKLRR